MAKKNKILIVDDDRNLGELLQLTLSSRGYQVILAYDGAEGLKKAFDQIPDLIILDVMMPKIDGWSVLQSLKINNKTASLPVIMLTTQDMIKDIEIGWSLGCAAYFTKPFQINRLVEKVDELLKPHRDINSEGT